MSLHRRFLAMTYDRQLRKVEQAGLTALRQQVLAGAAGRVLEIGAGTGANLPHYGPNIESLTVTEPEDAMLRRLERRVQQHDQPVLVLRAPAEDLPFEDAVFDVAVSTMVLCGVSDLPRALGEIKRVLRPGGRLLFLEHVRSDDAAVARKQDRLNGLNRLVAGCDCNRATLAAIQEAGFRITEIEHTAIPKVPAFVSPAIVGTATVEPGSLSGAADAIGERRAGTTSAHATVQEPSASRS